VPRGVDLRCKKRKVLSGKPEQIKNQRKRIVLLPERAEDCDRSRLVPPEWAWVRPESACATGVGLGATVSVDLCHRSGLKYLSHGFQTQGTVAARTGLRVRLESACVPRPWISYPRYGCHRSGLEGATGVDLCTWAMDFRPKVWLPP
jgi:hypothetical protein